MRASRPLTRISPCNVTPSPRQDAGVCRLRPASFTCRTEPTHSPRNAPIGSDTAPSVKRHGIVRPLAAFKLRERLGGKGAIGSYVPKPKWMRWSTYDREIARVEAAEEIVDAHISAFLEKPRRKKARPGVLTT